MAYILQCAWCGDVLGTKEVPRAAEPGCVTHTICLECRAAVLQGLDGNPSERPTGRNSEPEPAATGRPGPDGAHRVARFSR